MTYGLGEPTSSTPTHDAYLDLETDYMYQYSNGEWVLYARHGIPVGDEYLYGY